MLAAPVPTTKLPRPSLPLPGPKATLTPRPEGTRAADDSLTPLLPTVTPTPMTQPTPSPTPDAATTAYLEHIEDDLVNVRGGPGTNYAVVGQVRKGTELTIVGRNETGSWLRVCCVTGGSPLGADESWISAELVQVAMPPGVDMTGVPIAEIPPTPEAPPVAASAGNGAASAAALAAAPAPGMPGPGNFPAPGGTNPLTGLPLSGARAGQRPLIVCINNDYAARPQWGTSPPMSSMSTSWKAMASPALARSSMATMWRRSARCGAPG